MHGWKKPGSWLLAAAFVAITTTALAHELQHDLEQHDDSACALHLYAGGSAKAPAGGYAIAVSGVHDRPAVSGQTIFPFPPRVLGYNVRAPPASFVRSI